MAEWREWFVMTRHERRGAIGLLALLVLVIGTLWLVRSRTTSLTVDEVQQLQQFEAKVDSLTHASDSVVNKHGVKSRKGRYDTAGKSRKSKAKKPRKTPTTPRRVDPVPQF